MDNLVILLEKILIDRENREDLINYFQNKIFNINLNKDPNFNKDKFEILNELAYDLDFYEHNPELRKEDPSYYGEDRLNVEIKKALIKINKLNILNI